jgi:UDP-GlcNAc:undecaprenyl-phosphate GlcNAc-1-phosphate transferase
MTAYSIIVPLLYSFVFCYLLTPVLRDLTALWGWVDRPDHKRKIHKRAVPRSGGIAIVFGFAACYGALWVSTGTGDIVAVDQSLTLMWRLLPASALIFMTGILDDLINLRAKQKLGGQVLAAALAALGGVRFHIFEGYWWGDTVAVVLTLLWLVACTNALNLIDGLDGLAAGLAVIAAVTVLFAALLEGDLGLAVVAVSLIGSLLAFLRFNFNPASIFLGDSGSLWTGLMLGCFAILWFNSSASFAGMIAPFVALSIPLLDTALSIARRFISARPILGADHGHIHHRLLERGLSPRAAALSLYAAGGVASCFALLLTIFSDLVSGITVLAILGIARTGVQCLRYKEFATFAKLLRSIRSKVQSHLSVQSYESRLQNASNPEECWALLRQIGRDFELVELKLQLSDRCFEDPGLGNTAGTWNLLLPLTPSDYLSVARSCGSATTADRFPELLELIDMLHRTLLERAHAFRLTLPSLATNRVLVPESYVCAPPTIPERDFTIPDQRNNAVA